MKGLNYGCQIKTAATDLESPSCRAAHGACMLYVRLMLPRPSQLCVIKSLPAVELRTVHRFRDPFCSTKFESVPIATPPVSRRARHCCALLKQPAIWISSSNNAKLGELRSSRTYLIHMSGASCLMMQISSFGCWIQTFLHIIGSFSTVYAPRDVYVV